MGTNMFLAFDATTGTLVASGCVDAGCVQPVPIGLLSPGSCGFQQIAVLRELGAQVANYESAAYDPASRQVVFSVSNSTSSLGSVYALNLSSGNLTSSPETSSDNVGSLSFDTTTGLFFGVAQSGGSGAAAIASLVALNSTDLSWDVRGVIATATTPAGGLGAVGGGCYYFLAQNTLAPLDPPVLAAVDLSTGWLLSSTAIAGEVPNSLDFQP